MTARSTSDNVFTASATVQTVDGEIVGRVQLRREGLVYATFGLPDAKHLAAVIGTAAIEADAQESREKVKAKAMEALKSPAVRALEQAIKDQERFTSTEAHRIFLGALRHALSQVQAAEQ